MLEHVPHWLGSSLAKVRAGHDKLAVARLDLTGVVAFELMSSAFSSGSRLPLRFTADGDGCSPPLNWTGVPEGTESLALIVEDPDAPSPMPLVHAIVIDIDPRLAGLAEGAIRADGDGAGGKDVGKNSSLAEGWLPPDPPNGHGPHDYVFQLFALGGAGKRSRTRPSPGRSRFAQHVQGRILGVGILIGTYSRGEEARADPARFATAQI